MDNLLSSLDLAPEVKEAIKQAVEADKDAIKRVAEADKQAALQAAEADKQAALQAAEADKQAALQAAEAYKQADLQAVHELWREKSYRYAMFKLNLVDTLLVHQTHAL